MGSERADEILLVKYLLGELSEEEQVQVEDRAFSDVNYLTALESTEADLIDSWVRGELSQADRRAFEHRFFTSAERRRKVEFARDFSRIRNESRVAERAESGWVSTWQSLLFLMRGRNPRLAFAAIVGVFFVGGAWLIGQNSRIRSQIAALETQRRALESQHKQTLSQLEDEKRRAESLLSQLEKPSAAVNPTLVASLFLTPGLARSESRPQDLILRPSAQVARIGIQLEARDDYRRFRVELRTRSGNDVLTLGSAARGRESVAFDVPASALAAGEYELALKGVAADQSLTDIGYYYFRVQKP